MLGDRSGQGEANEGEKEIHVRLSTVKNLTKTYFFKKKAGVHVPPVVLGEHVAWLN